MDLLLKKKEADTYTDYIEIKDVKEAENNTGIQMFVTLSMLSWINGYTQKANEIKLSKEKTKKMSLLKSAGFTSTKDFKAIENEKNSIDAHNKEIQRIREGVSFLSSCFTYFGKNVRMITYKDFEILKEKYDLHTSLLEAYTGDIPDKNLKDVLKVKKILNNLDDYSSLGRHIKCVDIGSYTLPSFYKPFYRMNEYDKQRYPKMFILAPLSEINNSRVAMERMRVLDPLVCSYTDYGVLIYTAWGEEADDAIFDKYEELNNAILKITGNTLFGFCGSFFKKIGFPVIKIQRK